MQVLEQWLSHEEWHTASDELDVRTVTPSRDADPAAVDAWLGHELFRNYLDPASVDMLEAAYTDLGLPEVADHLANNTFPTDVIVRNGDFGEALGAAMFRRVRRYCVPVLRLRFKQRPNQPVQNVDFLAFRLREDPPIVAAPEVKTRTSRHLNVGVEAVESLARAINDLPHAILFCAAEMNKRGSVLAVRLAALLNTGYTLERHVLIVHDEELWDDRIVERLGSAVTDATEATVVRLPELDQVITRAFMEAVADAQRVAARRVQEASGA